MGTITTSTVLESLRYPNESMVDRRLLDGALYFLKRTGATSLDLFSSTNNGTSWSDVGVNITRANMQETSGLFIDSENHNHVCYRTYESGEDRIYYRRRNASTGLWETERLIASATAGSAGAVYTGVTVVSFKLGSTWYVFFAAGTQNGVNSGVTLFAATINSSGTFAVKNTLIDGYRQWLNGPVGVVHPALDFRHTGDSKSVGSGPALWVTWGRSTTYCVKASWSSGPTWYGPWTPTTVTTGLTNQDHNVGRYNGYGDKFHIAIPNGNTVSVIERKVDDSGATARTCPNAHPQGVTRYVALSNSHNSNSYRVFAVGTSNPDLYYVDYSAAAGTWGAWTLVTATDIVGTVPNNFSVRRNTHGNGQYDLAIAGGTTPYTLTHTSSTAASAPKTPVITSPENGQPQDVAAGLTITWTFTDDDPLDSQQAYALRRTIGASVTYWNQGTGLWQASEVFNTSGTTNKAFAAAWGTDADAPHFYAVKVRDQATLTSGYSSSVQVIPSGKDNPTLVTPGASVTTPQVTASWTVATQTAYMLELLVGAVVVYQSGWVSSTATSQVIPYVLVNAGSYTVRLTTRNDEGLTSNTVTQAFTVTFTAPATATIGLSPQPTLGVLRVNITNPTATGSQPDALLNNLFRRQVGEAGDGVLVASVGTSADPNLFALLNGGFESAFTGVNSWLSNNPAVSTSVRGTTQFLDGVASLEETAVSGANFAGTYKSPINNTGLPQIVAGQSYTLSHWVKGTAGRTVTLAIGWYNAANSSVGSSSPVTTLVLNGSWQQITHTATAPALATQANPILGGTTGTPPAVSEKLYIDRVSLTVTGATAPAVTVDDFTVASEVNYEYRVLTTGANGATVYSGWIS